MLENSVYFSTYRYEYWENSLLENCIQTCKLFMWNAIFCGVSSKYTNRGICTSVYQRALEIMTQNYNNFHGNRRRSFHADYGRPLLRLKVRKMSFENESGAKPSETVALLVAISHSDKSSRFHSKNGFIPMKVIQRSRWGNTLQCAHIGARTF